MPQSIFILCNIKYTYYIPTFLLFNYMYKKYIYNYYRKMNGLGFCESNEKYSILKKLVNYINLDPTINDSDKKNIEINKLKKVLGLGCEDTLNKILKGQTQPQAPPQRQAQPQTQTQPQRQTQTPQQTPPQTPPQARSPWYSSYMFLTNPTKQPDKREHSEFDIDGLTEKEIDGLNIEIKGLQHLNKSGEHRMTYYEFFEINNLLLDKYLDWYFKLTGVQHGYDDGNTYTKESLHCTKVIKLVKNEGKFSLINKYNTNKDYRKIDESIDEYKFNLYAKVAQGFNGNYYDKINISNIYTSTLINLNNNTDKRQQEIEEEQEEEQEEEREIKKAEEEAGTYKKKIKIPANLARNFFTFNELFKTYGLFNDEFNGKKVQLHNYEKTIRRSFGPNYKLDDTLFSLNINKNKNNDEYIITDGNGRRVNEYYDTRGLVFNKSTVNVEYLDEIIFHDRDLSEAYDKYNPPISSSEKESQGGKRISKGKSNKVAKKPVVSQTKQSVYKEIFGKQMKIYKMPDSRKEYVKYKGELHPISEYKSLMKQKAMAKPKAKK